MAFVAHFPRAAAAVCVAGVLWLPQLSAQGRAVSISSTPTCASCAAQITKLSTVGRSTDSVLVIETSWMVADKRGQFLVAPVSTPGAIAVYDSVGVLLRTIGRSGSGPGEFRAISRLWFGANDTLYIFDGGQARLTVLSPTYQFVRAQQLTGGSGDRLVLSDGQVVVSFISRNPDRIGFPFHSYSKTGEWVRSFGVKSATVSGFTPLPMAKFAAIRGDSFWASSRGRYDIELWSPRATAPAVTLRRVTTMFEPFVPVDAFFGLDGRFQPNVADMASEGRNRLWVVLWVEDPQYRPGPRPPNGLYMRPPLAELPRVIDSRVEILDPEAGSLLTSFPIPEGSRLLELPARGRVRFYAPAEAAEGYRYFNVWRVDVSFP